MKLVYSCVYATGSKAPGKEGPVILSSAAELTSFGYFQRSSVKEMFVFFSRTFAKNVKPGQRTSVKHEAYLCHMYCSPGGAPDPRAAVELEQPTESRPPPVPFPARTSAGVTAVCFADAEYPSRVAFGYLSKLCEDFTQATGGRLASSDEDGCMDAAFPAHPSLLAQFQDPAQADQLTRIMNELEETKVVLHDTIEAALERGQKIDTLIEKSNDLSGSSKMFYKTAKKQNQCCSYM